jgi:hypothetical protein
LDSDSSGAELTCTLDILGSEVTVAASDAASDVAKLHFRSGNARLLRQLKAELTRGKCEQLTHSAAHHVTVPFALVRQLDELKCVVDTLSRGRLNETFSDEIYRPKVSIASL